MVFWTVSHCTTNNYREKYAEALKKYVDVDIYGECANVTCKRKVKESCFSIEGQKYWFYLAFENSNCPDYITEKLWRALTLPVVPIVMGGGNYEQDAPPHSFINVNNFPSVKDLADYLTYLTKNTVCFILFNLAVLEYMI
jgi:hypothetical protein